MDNLGFIKIDRKILKNEIVCEDSEYFMIWIYLLLNATYRSYETEFKGEKIILKPGQLITGRNSISDKTKINPNKIQRVLKKFENRHLIEQEMSNKNRLITIIKWNEYQYGDIQMNNKRTTNEQQMNTNKNIKNIKNIYIYIIKKYSRGKFLTFKDKMKLLDDVKEDEDYKKMSYDEQYNFRTYVLSGG